MEPNRFSVVDPTVPTTDANRIHPRSTVVPVPVPVGDGYLPLIFVIPDHAAMLQTALAGQTVQFCNGVRRNMNQPERCLFAGHLLHLLMPVAFGAGDFVERVHGTSTPRKPILALIQAAFMPRMETNPCRCPGKKHFRSSMAGTRFS
jgi:hypothetical protein